MNDDEIIELSCFNDEHDSVCGICLDTKQTKNLIKTKCCKQLVHKICLLEWICFVQIDKNYKNKYECIMCKYKTDDLESMIPIKDFIYFIENKQHYINNDDLAMHYKKIINEMYKYSILYIIINNDIEKDKKLKMTDPICLIIFIVWFVLFLIFLLILVKK